MHYSTLAFPAIFLKLAAATYTLQDGYGISSFFGDFSFWTGGDPTHGYVNYVDQSTAQNDGLINTNNNQIYIGVDSTNPASDRGRTSVRLTSTASYNHGLFVLDLAHMPGSICGTWPAFWLVGPNWPNEGEIDILEGVNDNTNNAMTLHTSGGCTIADNGGFTGTLGNRDCDSSHGSNTGCGIQNQDKQSYGSGFNSVGGGVYATEWTSSDINVWFFVRGNIPSDIVSGNPNPTTWGTPAARFQGDCNIDDHFKNQQIVFDTTFCGDWAGAVFSSSQTCSALASSCEDYVRNNPSAFADAYWLINSLKVYQSNGTPARLAHASSSILLEKNQTLPLGTQVPVAMGGGSPASKTRRGGRSD